MILAKWLKILREMQQRNETLFATARRLMMYHPEYTEQDRQEIMATERAERMRTIPCDQCGRQIFPDGRFGNDCAWCYPQQEMNISCWDSEFWDEPPSPAIDGRPSRRQREIILGRLPAGARVMWTQPTRGYGLTVAYLPPLRPVAMERLVNATR